MIDPLVRPIDVTDEVDVAQLLLLENEARAAVVDQRGGERWLIEHPRDPIDNNAAPGTAAGIAWAGNS